MGIFESIKNSIQGSMEKKRLEKEQFEKLKREAEMQKKILFEEEFKKNALEVAKAQAKKEAAEKSGLQKLRAINRRRRLNSESDTNSFFSKLREHTQRNLAKREENLKRTEEMRKAAKEEREKLRLQRGKERQERMARSNVKKPFSSTPKWY